MVYIVLSNQVYCYNISRMKYLIDTISDFDQVINIVKEQIALEKVLIVYLEGDLGTGKTTFSQNLAKAIGINTKVTSPTFTIINEYKTEELKLYHLDLYRINTVTELDELGLSELKLPRTGKTLVLIEWANLFENELNEEFKDLKRLKIKFDYDENIVTGRIVDIML